MSIESGDYKINVGEKGQLHYDAYEKRFFVEEDEWTKVCSVLCRVFLVVDCIL